MPPEVEDQAPAAEDQDQAPNPVTRAQDNPFPEDTTPTPQTGTIPEEQNDQQLPVQGSGNPQQQPVGPVSGIPSANEMPSQAMVLKQAPHTGFRGVLDRVLDAISGTQDSQLYTDDQGNTYVQHPDLSTGAKWARAAAILGGGAAHGLAAGRGGNFGAAAAAGFDTGMGMRQGANEADTQNRLMASKLNTDNLNHVLMNQKIAENAFALTRMGVVATQDDIKHEDEMVKNEEAMKSTYAGTYDDITNLPDVQKNHPDILKKFFTTPGDIRLIKHIDPATGKFAGMQVYIRPAGSSDQIVPPGSKYRIAVPDESGGTSHYEWNTTTAAMKQSDFDLLDKAAVTTKTSQDKDQAELKQKNVETQKNQVEIDQAPLKAADLRAGINQKNAAAALDIAKAQAQRDVAAGLTLPMTADGKVDLTQVPATNVATARRIARGDGLVQELVGRGSPAQREYWNNLVMAVDPSYTGPRTYEERVKATKDESPAGDVGKQITSFNQFLRHMQNVSDAVQNLRHGNAEWINTPMDKLSSKMSANPQLADMVPKVTAAREELQRFLNGNHALQKEDIKAGYDMLNEHMAPSALQAAARSGALTAVERMDEINNGHRRVFNGENLPGILSPESAQSLRHFGLKSYLDRLQVLGSTNQTTNQPNTQQGTALQIQPGEHITTNAQTGQQIVYRNNQWLDVKTGKPLQ